MKRATKGELVADGRHARDFTRGPHSGLAALSCGALALILGCGGGGDATPGSGGSAGTTGGTGGTTGGTGGSTGGTTGGTGGSTGGSTGGTTGGSGGTGGSTGGTTGGTGGTTGGSTGGTGDAGMGGSGNAGTGGGSSICTFEQTASLSPNIGTVGIVTFSTSMSGVASAKIDFGLTTAYGYTAPVDLTQPSNRTLLLGMKSSQTYHYRITATGPSGDCQSPDYTIETGPLANGLVKPTVTTQDASALAGGFLITGQYVQNSTGSGPAFIVDSDGDIVWWFNIEDYVTGVVMNYAGTHMWINNHPPNLANAKVHRVSMDGMVDEDFTDQMQRLSHQLTVLPDETLAFYADDGGEDECNDIKERKLDGSVRTLVNSQTALGTTGKCHLNDIQYSPDDDTLIFSDHIHCAIAKIRRTDGSTVWVLNGETKTFEGDVWLGSQHGIHVLGVDNLLIFNNNSRSVAGSTASVALGAGDGSRVIEMKLDLDEMIATEVWSYKGDGIKYQTDVMGDLQRLWNGNVIVAYGGKGIIQEIKPDGTVVQEMKTTTNFGYIQKRQTLYGKPPR